MKTTNRFFVIMAVILLSFSINSCNQCKGSGESGDAIEIILYVDTDNINQQNINSTSNFGQPVGESNKEFTTYVELGKDIIWVGKSLSSPETDEVRIRKIKHKSGSVILNRRELTGRKKVRGKVSNGKVGDEEYYSVHFTVFNNGTRRNGTFIIDPKIQMN